MIMIEIEMNNQNECSKQFGIRVNFPTTISLAIPAGKRSFEFLEISSFCEVEYS